MYVCERGREVCVGGERERVCESKCLSKNVRERYCFSKREREKTRGSISSFEWGVRWELVSYELMKR